MMKPVELEIELFCRGMRIDDTTESRSISRTRAGLGSGLEVILRGGRKDIWVNVPVVEPFAQHSPFLLRRRSGSDGDQFVILDGRHDDEYPVDIPPEPKWYSRHTSSDVLMSRIGVLQGNYVGIYVSSRCAYWAGNAELACRFCTTGANVGSAEEARKSVEDVVEVARAARDESGSIFTHFNTGYHYEEDPRRERFHGLRQCEPYVQAVRRYVGGFIGVQAVPVPRASFHEYDALIAAGTDHFSFCYELEDPEYFARICPGKEQSVGQRAFFEAMEYTAKKLGRGRVSGEIIAGIEPIEATKRGIDRIVNAGAFPTVCIFRPTVGSAMADIPPPDPAAMKEVFAHLHESCRRARLPVGILPIEVSLMVQPEETADLVEPNLASSWYGLRNRVMRRVAAPYVAWKRAAAGA
jgi:solute carrier family 13 (sodium-dependent dicarboxylate transporter), member 2/3/5